MTPKSFPAQSFVELVDDNVGLHRALTPQRCGSPCGFVPQVRNTVDRFVFDQVGDPRQVMRGHVMGIADMMIALAFVFYDFSDTTVRTIPRPVLRWLRFQFS